MAQQIIQHPSTSDIRTDASLAPVFDTQTNCWRIEKAERFSMVVDGADYFTALRKVCMAAKHELLLIGWDFDFQIEMMPGQSDSNGNAPDGLPNKLGKFFEALVDHTPDLHIYALKWNGAVLVAPGQVIPPLALTIFGHDHLHFALDGHHPFGACHHQKIVIADDGFAFCGGIDMTENRWDTSEHLPNDPRRVHKDGTPSTPWHDVTTALTGPAASALAALSRTRWYRATGEELEVPQTSDAAIWPEGLNVDAQNVEVAISRTKPPYDGELLVNEIEHMFLDSIRSAKDVIYIESQYFTAQTICDALEARLIEEGGPEIVVINPKVSLSSFEDDAMNGLRDRLIERLKGVDHEDRFRIYYPVTTAEEPIYIHAKIMIADTKILICGSSNLNDRSLGFDTECNVAVSEPQPLIAELRTRLIAEHLGVTAEVYEKCLEDKGSLIAVIEALNDPESRGLRAIERRIENLRTGILADTRLMDPRYVPGQQVSAGQGIRPRHLAMASGALLLGYLSWRILRK